MANFDQAEGLRRMLAGARTRIYTFLSATSGEEKGATLVNLATWFWVSNVEGALAEDGVIHLEAHIPNSPVRTTIEVGTTGVDITSPAGATTCAIAQAKTSYAPGASDGDACTVAFAKGNRAGWPVTSSLASAVSGMGRSRQRARTSRPR